MGNKRMAGLWVLILGLLLGIWNMDTPAFSGIAIFGNILTIGISILMLYKCKRSDIMADLHAAIVGSSWGVLLGISLTAGVCKLFNSRSVHPYDEAAFGIICVVSLLLVLIIGWIDGTVNAERRSFRRFLLQGCIRLLNIGEFPVFFILGDIGGRGLHRPVCPSSRPARPRLSGWRPWMPSAGS